MIRQLSNLVLAFSLVAGGWGCVLAAALCGHPGCAPSGASAGHGSRASELSEAAGHGAHEGPSGSDAHAEHSEHDSSAAEHSGHDSSDEAPPAAGMVTPNPDLPLSRLTSGAAPCGHCVGGPGPRRSTTSERQANQPQRLDGAGDPLPTRQYTPPDTAFVRDVIPSQGAPPGLVSAHILNSVFRI